MFDRYRYDISEGAKIIVVEDEIIISKDIKEKLNNLGYNVLAVVSSGEESIEKVKELKPDLVLMDIQLEEEMDGVEAAEEITKKFGVPIIFLTSYSDNNTFYRAIGAEASNYIVKPFDEEELKAAIEIILAKNNIRE